MAAKKLRRGTRGAGLTVESYLARCGARNERTLENYRRVFEGAQCFIGKALARATKKDVERLKVEWLSPPRFEPSTAYVIAGWLRSFFKKAGRAELADILHLKRYTRRLRPEEILSPSEVRSLIEACDNLRDRALIGVLWDCGVRVSEVLNLALKDVREKPANARPRAYVLSFGPVKETGEEHLGFVLETADALAEWLTNYPFSWNDHAPLFPSFSGRFLTAPDGWRIVQKAAKRAHQGKHVYPHAFRHGRATDLLRRRVDRGSIKRLLGWSPSSTVLDTTYDHLLSENSFHNFLRTDGHPVPTATQYEGLAINRDELKPVRPVVARPGALASGTGLTERIAQVFTELLANADEEMRAKLLKELTA